MRLIKDKNYRNLAIVISIPLLIIAQYYLFKFGVLRPMVKGVEIQIVDGEYIKDIDKYVVKLNDTLELSIGDYITIPSYAKEPNIRFKVLDNTETLKIEGNKMTALKEGFSSIGIMKNSRVLKKATIKVVDPKVENLNLNISDDLNYVGDTAKINSTVQVDYKKFEDSYKAVYESSNENILRIENNEIKAVGVGTATVYAKSGDKEESISYTIRAKVAKIEISDNLQIEIGQNQKLNPSIITSPRNLKHPNITYELLGSKIPVSRAIRLDSDGTVVGLREGEEKVKIICGNKSKIITINVVKESITNKSIENLNLTYEVVDNKMIVKLTWDYFKDVFNYDIYLRNNTLNESEFKMVKSINIKESEVGSDKKVTTTLEIDLTNNQNQDLDIYVVGKTTVGNTKQSNTQSIKYDPSPIENEKVENLSGTINKENNTVEATWGLMNNPNYTYSVYIKDNTDIKEEFRLYKDNLNTNNVTIDTKGPDINLDIYVIANYNGRSSIKSEVINIK
ncbi:hypothetical protein CHF27_002685 [Romboutsia maritimum]|uniref:BIG2 domain-containing protein n=1 Tax=Romboutsia maritimum TaxID=2020948 RepID=A0A371IVS3_9FIRM|nr:hypothetical protein [Romboutsia maritimum]RDY24566.1 hypothetical protein CHF27_002685 [Romboutsia maritimum]